MEGIINCEVVCTEKCANGVIQNLKEHTCVNQDSLSGENILLPGQKKKLRFTQKVIRFMTKWLLWLKVASSTTSVGTKLTSNQTRTNLWKYTMLMLGMPFKQWAGLEDLGWGLCLNIKSVMLDIL